MIYELNITDDFLNKPLKPIGIKSLLSLNESVAKVNWGDGSPAELLCVNGKITEHNYTTKGTYFVKAHASMGHGYGAGFAGAISKILQVPKYEYGRINSFLAYACSEASNMTYADFSNLAYEKGVTKFNVGAMFMNCKKLKTVIIPSDWIIDNCDSMFDGCASLESVDFIESWDTSKVTSMHATFGGCNNLISLDLSKWDVSNVSNMSWMFSWCENLVNLTGIDRWNVEKVKNMWSMFLNCKKLPNLDLSSWNISNVTNMAGMFQGTSELNSLTLNWDLSHVLTLSGMFQGTGLSTIEGITFSEEPPSNTDVNQRRNISNFVRGCPNLTSINIDLRGFCRHDEMFRESPKISYIKSIDFTHDIIENANFAWGTRFNNLTDLNITGTISVSIPHGFNNMPNLTTKCLTDIINALVDLSGSNSKICYLGATNLAKLSSDVITIATNKNWTLQ